MFVCDETCIRSTVEQQSEVIMERQLATFSNRILQFETVNCSFSLAFTRWVHRTRDIIQTLAIIRFVVIWILSKNQFVAACCCVVLFCTGIWTWSMLDRLANIDDRLTVFVRSKSILLSQPPGLGEDMSNAFLLVQLRWSLLLGRLVTGSAIATPLHSQRNNLHFPQISFVSNCTHSL